MDSKTHINPLEAQSIRPVIFGEVLFDCFEKKAVLGGAPLNVAWHLQALGWNPLLISRIGTDDQGREIITRMQDRGMDTTGIQRDMNHPTGRVEVKMDGSSHTFQILENQAYDHIAPEEALGITASQKIRFLYHGSLALRAESRETFLRLSEAADASVFLDINLRAPWWTKAAVLDMIQRANILKLNDEELRLLCPESMKDAPLEQAAAQACSEWKLDTIWLTLGAKGAFYCSANGDAFSNPPTKSEQPLVDTVGAGDAFSSAILGGLLKGSSPRETAECAALLATRVCGRRGATTTDSGLYQGLEAVANG